MKFSKKTKLAFSIEGEGIPIVLIHGFCEDSNMWNEVINTGFPGIQIIRVDLPGFGQSPISQNFSITEMADIFHELVLELNLSKFYLFGHSMGGYVGLEYMAKNPQSVIGFGLINSHPFADSPEGKNKRQKAIDFINRFGSTLFIKQTISALFPTSFSQSNRFLLERLIFEAMKYPSLGITNALDAMKVREDRSTILKNLKVPFLSIVGAEDHLLPQEKLLQQASMASVTQFELIENIGHMGPFESPEKINQIIKGFIKIFPPKELC